MNALPFSKTSVNDQHLALEQQADLLELTLQRHEAPARVTGGNVTPRWIQFMAQPASSTPIARIVNLSRVIALALGTPSARITTQGSAVRIDIPRSDPRSVSLFNLLQRLPAGRVPSYTAVLGMAEDGAPLLARLPSPDVQHLLITGGPHTGKTALAMTIGLSLAARIKSRALQLVAIGADLSPLTQLPHAGAIAAEVCSVLSLADRRGPLDLNPRVILLIDGLDTLSTNERQAVDTLLVRGAPAGVHVIGVTNETPAQAWPVTLTAKASRRPGAFMAQSLHGNIDFEAAYADASEVAALMDVIKGDR
jgi:S-DNA-T family DNA segregation ATPase FtsK/SpoIIIE